MAEFAEFVETSEDTHRLNVVIVPLSKRDLAACAALAAAREGASREPWIVAFERALDDARQLVLVAHEGTRVVGYGKATFLELSPEAKAPSGWYLTGVVVEPDLRRRGVGQQLTSARLAELEGRGAQHVFYFANARNRASLALHEHLGFREVTRDFAIPGVSFAGGQGVLARWEAPRRA